MSALHDNFNITAGSSLTGHTPDTPVGSATWTDFVSSLSLPAWVGAPSGSGITSPSGALAFGGYDLSSLPASLTVTFQFTSASTVPSIVTQHRRTAGASPSYIGLDFVLAGQVNLTTVDSGGAATPIGSPGTYTFAAATAYTIAIQFVTSGGTTTVDVSINGTAVITGATISDAALQSPGQLVLGTENGSAGDVVISSLDVPTSAGGPTTATLSNGPANCTAGVESAPYGVQLDAAAPSGGTAINLSSSVGGDAFHATSGGPAVTAIAIAPGQTLGAFRLVAASAGVRNISITSTGLSIVDSPLAVTAAAPPSVPTTATLTGPTACTVGVESSAVVVTLDAPAPSGGTAILIGHTGSGDVFSATSGGPNVAGIVIPQGQSSGSFFILAGAAGSRSVSITSTGLAIVGSPLNYTATAPATAGPLEGYYPTPSLTTLYFVRGKPNGLAWNGTGYEAEVASNWSSYALPAADVGGTGRYTGPDPDPSTPGRARLYKMAGGAASPADLLVDAGEVGPPGVTQAQLAAALASLATTAQLTTAVGPLATTAGLSTLAANTPSNSSLTAALAPLARASQVPANLTNNLFSAPGVFAASALANVPASANGGFSADPWAIMLPGAYPPGSAGDLVGNALGLSTAQAVSATTLRLAASDQGFGQDLAGFTIYLATATAGACQYGQITSSDLATGDQAIAGWSKGIDPVGPATYFVILPQTDKAGYKLGPAGFDAIPVEAGVNARQALSPILAASAGVLAGSGTGTITIKGGGANNATSRITATTDGTGDRTSVTLNLPA